MCGVEISEHCEGFSGVHGGRGGPTRSQYHVHNAATEKDNYNACSGIQ